MDNKFIFLTHESQIEIKNLVDKMVESDMDSTIKAVDAHSERFSNHMTVLKNMGYDPATKEFKGSYREILVSQIELSKYCKAPPNEIFNLEYKLNQFEEMVANKLSKVDYIKRQLEQSKETVAYFKLVESIFLTAFDEKVLEVTDEFQTAIYNLIGFQSVRPIIDWINLVN